MTANHSPDAAVDDADLIRYLDGELDDDGHVRIDDAVARDPAIAARLELLRGRSRRLSALLVESDPEFAAAGGHAGAPSAAHGRIIELNAAWAARQGMPARTVPPPGTIPGWLRAGAVLVVLLGGSLLVPPVRAWVSGLLRPAPGPDTFAPVPVVPAAEPVDTLGIHFASAAGALTIRFEAVPASGTLTVEWRDVDSVGVDSYSAGGRGSLVRIRDDLVRINNGTAPVADYHVVLPARTAELRIQVPGRPEAVWRAGPASAGRRIIDLGKSH